MPDFSANASRVTPSFFLNNFKRIDMRGGYSSKEATICACQ
jgi:hypothetical protein